MTYEEFVGFLFQRHEEGTEWYFAEGFVPPELNSETQVLFATQIFKNAAAHAKRFTERQFCLGLNYLINPAASWHCYSYLESSVNETVRLSVFDSMYDVFSLVFDLRCRETVSSRVDLQPAAHTPSDFLEFAKTPLLSSLRQNWRMQCANSGGGAVGRSRNERL